MALMESQSNAINSFRASHVIREGSVNSMKVDHRYLAQIYRFDNRFLDLRRNPALDPGHGTFFLT
jgi:hypothetical protein